MVWQLARQHVAKPESDHSTKQVNEIVQQIWKPSGDKPLPVLIQRRKQGNSEKAFPEQAAGLFFRLTNRSGQKERKSCVFKQMGNFVYPW